MSTLRLLQEGTAHDITCVSRDEALRGRATIALWPRLVSCPVCRESEVRESPPPGGHHWKCGHCREIVPDDAMLERGRQRSRDFSLVAFLFLLIGFATPMFWMRQVGGHRETLNLWQAVAEAWHSKAYALALLGAGLSGAFPVIKLIFIRRITRPGAISAHHGRRFYRVVELTKSWSLFEPLVGAVAALSLKPGPMFNMQFEVGFYAFLLAVVFNILASRSVDTGIFGRIQVLVPRREES